MRDRRPGFIRGNIPAMLVIIAAATMTPIVAADNANKLFDLIYTSKIRDVKKTLSHEDDKMSLESPTGVFISGNDAFPIVNATFATNNGRSHRNSIIGCNPNHGKETEQARLTARVLFLNPPQSRSGYEI